MLFKKVNHFIFICTCFNIICSFILGSNPYYILVGGIVYFAYVLKNGHKIIRKRIIDLKISERGLIRFLIANIKIIMAKIILLIYGIAFFWTYVVTFDFMDRYKAVCFFYSYSSCVTGEMVPFIIFLIKNGLGITGVLTTMFAIIDMRAFK